jgi:hypothetical protein
MQSGRPNSNESEQFASDRNAGGTIGQLQPSADEPSGIFDRILSGMAARNHVLEAISLYLRLSLTELVTHIVRLGLPMPSDLPMRRPGGRRPWSVTEIRLLIERWPQNLHVDCIGGDIERSPGAVRAKARRLGLYRRNRRDLIKVSTGPAESAAIQELEGCGVGSVFRVHAEDVSPSPDLASEPPNVPAPTAADEDGAPIGTATATEKPHGEQCKTIETTQIRRRPRIQWNDELDMQVAQRWFAWQCRHGIAKDLGLTEAAVRSRATLLGLPPRTDRKKIVPDYVPGRPYDTSLEKGLVRRRCEQGHMYFYGTPNGPRTCPKVRKSRSYRELRSGLAEAYLHL